MITVAIPARDEAATIGAIVEAIRPLVDLGEVGEIIVCDDGSIDGTADEAAAAGAKVVVPEPMNGSVDGGKGHAMRTLLLHAEGDVIVYLDADLESFDASWITRLVTPLIQRPELSFVKGRFSRPHGDDPEGGGRVTALTARPAISLLFPELSGIAQPLGGELAGRRSVLERLTFVEGWGVDVGLLIDVVRLVGIEGVAQVDLGVRRHRNKSLAELEPMAVEVLRTVLDKAGVSGR